MATIRIFTFVVSFLAIALCFTFPVSASEEMVINGDFETGDFTGWSYSGNVDVANFGAGHETAGRLMIYGSTGVRYFEQSIDVTGVDEITFYSWFGGGGSGSAYARVLFDGQQKYYWTYGNDHGWTARSIDVSSLSGNKTLRFEGVFNSGNSITAGFDDVSALAVASVPVDTLYIAGVSSNRQYYVNASAHTYATEFYFQERLDISVGEYKPGVYYYVNCTSNNASYPYGYEYFFDPGHYESWEENLNTLTMSPQRSVFDRVNVQYRDVPVEYTFNLYEVDADISGLPWYFIFYQPLTYIMSLLSPSDATYTLLDTNSIVLNLVDSVPVLDPEQQVETDPYIEDPLVEMPSNYTPPVLMPEGPFSSDSGQEYHENITYNSTYLASYYSGLDDLRGGLYGTIASSVGYLMGPVDSINSSVSDSIQYVDSSFGNAREYDGVISVLFFPIIASIPTKIINLLTYYLVWVLIIMILRRR